MQNSEYTFEATSSSNGFVIFDADLSNTPANLATDVKRTGQLISPTIDLSNFDNITLSFEHQFAWCCSGQHKILVSISNDNGATRSYDFKDKI